MDNNKRNNDSKYYNELSLKKFEMIDEKLSKMNNEHIGDHKEIKDLQIEIKIMIKLLREFILMGD